MDPKPSLTLHGIRKNGRRERTDLANLTLQEARALAARVLAIGKGLYTKVEICSEERVVETIQSRRHGTNGSASR